MKQPRSRHYTEEEILLQLLRQESVGLRDTLSAHLNACEECTAIFEEYRELLARITAWPLPEPPEETWQIRKARLMILFRRDRERMSRRGFRSALARNFQIIWNYVLDNPLPTLGYIAAAVAFASERTITLFRLDRVLPASSEIFQILRQVLSI